MRNLTDHMGNNLLHIVCRQVSITGHFSHIAMIVIVIVMIVIVMTL